MTDTVNAAARKIGKSKAGRQKGSKNKAPRFKRILTPMQKLREHVLIELNLDKVEALKVEQGFWGRMLNYGTILLSGAGTSVAPMRDIADPLVFRRKFMEATQRPMSMPRQP